MSCGRSWIRLAGIALAMLGILGAVSGPVTEPAPTSWLRMPTQRARKKPLVSFSHRLHKEAGIPCAKCHHVYQARRNVWRQGQPVKRCPECHSFFPKGGQPDLKSALHLQCKDCHLKLRQQGRRAGPIDCKDCHRQG
ncbi:MAG: cytochrome c family protein [Deltaproteobacteria bacterium]|nr:cytochrome c family protein [Deltaproteobacteria bacterium]